MDLQAARAILNEAISGGDLDVLPETEEEILELAEYFATEAEKAYNAGWGKTNETVKAIIGLTAEEESSNESTHLESQAEANAESSSVGSSSVAFFKGLPQPELSDGAEGFHMPWNIADLSPVQLRKYHGIMNHYYGAARYQLAEESSTLREKELLKDDAFRSALTKASADNVRQETKKPGTVLTAEAESDAEYRKYALEVNAHEQNVIKLKALVEIYGKNVDVLSREATIRQNEFERSR